MQLSFIALDRDIICLIASLDQCIEGHHDIYHNVARQNDAQHNDTLFKGFNCDTEHIQHNDTQLKH
jgi:hypothetical protein